MLNERLLNGEMAKAGLTGIELAKRLGITPKTFYTKKKKGTFGSEEMVIIARECQMEDPLKVFFPEWITK